MHELSICQALIKQVEHVAVQHNAKNISSIVISVGPLSGVEIQLLKNVYPVASEGTIAESAELVIKQVPLRIKCNQCGVESDGSVNSLTCKQCGDWRTTLISGDELMLMSVELEKTKELKSIH